MNIPLPSYKALAVKNFTLSTSSPMAHSLRAIETYIEDGFRKAIKTDSNYYLVIRMESTKDWRDGGIPPSRVNFDWKTRDNEKILLAKIKFKKTLNLAEIRLAIAHEIYHIIQYAIFHMKNRKNFPSDLATLDKYNTMKNDGIAYEQSEQNANLFASWLCHCHYKFLSDDKLREHYKSVSDLFETAPTDDVHLDINELMTRLHNMVINSPLNGNYIREGARDIFSHSNSPDDYAHIIKEDTFDDL